MSEYINYQYDAECQVCFETGLLVYDGLCINCIYEFLKHQPLTNHFHSKVFKTFDLLYYTSINDKITKLVIEQLKNKIEQDVELNFKGYIERKVKDFKHDFGINVITKYNKTKLDYLMDIVNNKFEDLTIKDYTEVSNYTNTYKQYRLMTIHHEQLIECIIKELDFVLVACPMDELHTIYDVLFKNVRRYADKKCMSTLTDSTIVYLIYDTARNYLFNRKDRLSRDNVKKLFRELCQYVPFDVETLINVNSRIVGLCNNCQGKVNHDYICIQCGTEHCRNCFKNKNTSDSKHICDQQARDDYKFLVNTTVMCPTCGFRVTKNGGCKHMFCLRCRTSYDVDGDNKKVTKTKDTHTNPDEHRYYVNNDLLLSHSYIKHFTTSLFNHVEDNDEINDVNYEEIIQRVMETMELGPHMLQIPDIRRGIRDDLEILFGDDHTDVIIIYNELRTRLVIEDSEEEILRVHENFMIAFNEAIESFDFSRNRTSEGKSKSDWKELAEFKINLVNKNVLLKIYLKTMLILIQLRNQSN